MWKPFTVVKALGIGAGAMYLFDPELGYRRRAKLVERVTDAISEVNNVMEAACQGACDMARDFAGNSAERIKEEVRSRAPKQASFIEDAADKLGMPKSGLVRATTGAALIGHSLLSRSLMAKVAGTVGFTLLAKALEQSKLGGEVRMDQRSEDDSHEDVEAENKNPSTASAV